VPLLQALNNKMQHAKNKVVILIDYLLYLNIIYNLIH